MRILLSVLFVGLGVVAVASRIATGPLFAEERGPQQAAWTDDFLQDYVSARAWRDGADPYTETAVLRDAYVGDAINDGAPVGQANPHPPLAFLIVSPLSFLSYDAARALWLVLSAGAIALAIGAVARELGASRAAAAVAGMGVLALPVVQKDLSFGQNNGMILVLLAGTWLSMRRDRHVAAGVLLGLAVAIKLYPIFLLIPLVRVGARRPATWTLLSAAGTWGVAAVLVGWSAIVTFATDVSPANFDYWRAGPMNLSLIALPFRWLAENPWRDAAFDLPVLAAAAAVLAAAACLVAAASTRARATGDVFWAGVPWMILATPLAWEHYLVLAIPVVGLAMMRAIRTGESRLLAVAVVAALVVIGTPPGVSVTVPGISDVVQVLAYGLPLYGLLGLALLDLRRQRDGGPPGLAESIEALPRPHG